MKKLKLKEVNKLTKISKKKLKQKLFKQQVFSILQREGEH